MKPFKRYEIWYRGVLAEVHVNRMGASKRANELTATKGWAIGDIEVREIQ